MKKDPLSHHEVWRRPRKVVREVLFFRDREIDLHRRAYKRSIGLTLQVSGRIRVSAPMMMPQTRIMDFLLAHHEWIEANLSRYEMVRAAYPKKEYCEAERFPFLGDRLTLVFECADAKTRSGRHRFRRQGEYLVCSVPPENWKSFDVERPHPELAKPLAEFYAESAKEIIGERVKYFSERMGLFPSGVRFRSQKTRWGSCSSRGRISLNWRLMVAPRDVIDYVVVHELAHLKHYNHSAPFWKLVASQVERYAEHRDWLRDHQYEGDFLAKISELYGER